MPINAGAVGIQPIGPQRPAGGVDGIQRRDDGTSAGFRPQTEVSLKTAIEDLAATLGRIASQEKFGIERLPANIGQVVRNILQQSLSMEETLAQGIGSTIESQRFSTEQLTIFARMLAQIGALAEKGFSMELSDDTKALLSQFKNLVVASEGGKAFEPVLISKAAFELVDSKTPEQLPPALQEILTQLSQPPASGQSSEPMQFLKQLVDFLMPRPREAGNSAQIQQQAAQVQQQARPTATQQMLNSVYRQFDAPYSQQNQQPVAQGQASNFSIANQPVQTSFAQSAQPSQPQSTANLSTANQSSQTSQPMQQPIAGQTANFSTANQQPTVNQPVQTQSAQSAQPSQPQSTANLSTANQSAQTSQPMQQPIAGQTANFSTANQQPTVNQPVQTQSAQSAQSSQPQPTANLSTANQQPIANQPVQMQYAQSAQSSQPQPTANLSTANQQPIANQPVQTQFAQSAQFSQPQPTANFSTANQQPIANQPVQTQFAQSAQPLQPQPTANFSTANQQPIANQLVQTQFAQSAQFSQPQPTANFSTANQQPIANQPVQTQPVQGQTANLPTASQPVQTSAYPNQPVQGQTANFFTANQSAQTSQSMQQPIAGQTSNLSTSNQQPTVNQPVQTQSAQSPQPSQPQPTANLSTSNQQPTVNQPVQTQSAQGAQPSQPQPAANLSTANQQPIANQPVQTQFAQGAQPSQPQPTANQRAEITRDDFTVSLPKKPQASPVDEDFIARQRELMAQMQFAKTQLLQQPMQNTPQTTDALKNLAQFLMRNPASSETLSPRETNLLQNFVNKQQPIFPRDEARHLQNLLRLCQQNVPAVVQQAAAQHKLPDLPRLWAFMQLCDMASLPAHMPARALKRAAREVSDFSNAIRQSMGADNTTVQNQRSFQMMLPLYLGGNISSYPTYLSVYDETARDKETGAAKKETWLRICVLTDNIGAAELIFRVYEKTQLDMRFYFSQGEVAEDFKEYVASLREFIGGTAFNIGEIRIGSIGEKMLLAQ